MRPTGTVAVANRAAGVFLSALLLASCGATDGGDGTRPSISPTRTPTAELPSTSETASAPGTEEPGTEEPGTEEPADEPTSEDPSPELPSTSRTPERTEGPEEPETPLTTTLTTTLTPTATQPQPEPEPEETSTAQEPEAQGPEEEEPEAETAEDDGVPTWAWWLAGALVVAALVAVPLVVRSRRRTAWDQDLAAAEGDVAWLARELLPSCAGRPPARSWPGAGR